MHSILSRALRAGMRAEASKKNLRAKGSSNCRYCTISSIRGNKAISLSLNVVVTVVILLLLLAIVMFFVSDGFDNFDNQINECSTLCVDESNQCPNGPGVATQCTKLDGSQGSFCCVELT